MFHDRIAAEEPTRASTLAQQAAELMRNSRAAALFSTAVSLALLVAVAFEIQGMNLDRMAAMVPREPAFWIAFAAWYLTEPACEWVIFRKLWHIPAWGLGALMRKMVSNELLLGYLGEVQFYAWARSRSRLTAAPFGAIKDVAILSALCGNIVAIVMLAIAWPLVSAATGGFAMQSTFVSLGVVLLSSFAILLLRHKIFSLPSDRLRFIAIVHFTRILAKAGLGALLWYMVLPATPMTVWLVLSALRMLVSRLPLLPNKDVIFAGLAVLLLGHQVETTSLLAMTAALVVIGHVVTGGSFALADLVDAWRRRNA